MELKLLFEKIDNTDWRQAVYGQLYASVLQAKDDFVRHREYASFKTAYIESIIAFLSFVKAIDEDFEYDDEKDVIDDFDAIMQNKNKAFCKLVELSDN